MAHEAIDDPLHEQEKKRIRLEESYRRTVSDELGQRKVARGGLSTFVNSSFGLWLLSAIFISGAGKLYADYQNDAKAAAQIAESKRAEESRIRDLVQRIDLEMSYRLSVAMSKLRAAEGGFDKEPAHLRAPGIKAALAPLASPMSAETPPLFPEFRQHSGLALIAELRRHVSPGEQQRLRNILVELSALLRTLDAPSADGARRPKIVAGDLIGKMKGERWDNGFHLTDCSREKPFC